MNIHRHRRYQRKPFMFLIALANDPLQAPSRVMLVKKRLYLFCASWRLYHFSIRWKDPGNMPDSKKPKKKRAVRSPPLQLC